MVETQAAKKFIAAVSSLNFNPAHFTIYLGQQSNAIQNRVLDLFMSYVDYLSLKLDENLWSDDDDLDLCARGKRMQDAMVPFR